MRRKLFLLLLSVYLLLNNIISTNATTCKRDTLIFGDGDVEVDWWLTIKIKGFTDLYLYFDSLMEEANEKEFKKGSFLRTQYSALGKTLLPYTGINISPNKYFAYGDSLRSYSDGIQSRNSAFYDYGAHEKGFFGWGGGYKGIHIQHSLPSFPAVSWDKNTKKEYLSPPMDPIDFMKYYNGLETTIGPFKPMDYFYLFAKLGWNDPFFNSNLCSYHSQSDPNDLGLPMDEVVGGIEDDNWKIGQQTIPTEKVVTSMRGDGFRQTKGAILKPYDINAYGIIQTNYIKPSQHILCTTLREKENFEKLIENMASLSKKGLYTPVHNLISSDLTDLDPNRASLSIPTNFIKKDKTITGNGNIVHFESEPKDSKTKYYHKVNYGDANKIDVWESVFRGTSGATSQPRLDSDEVLYISTWSQSSKDDSYKSAWFHKEKDKDKNILIPSLKVTLPYGLGETVWTGFSNQDHSKIAFKQTGKENSNSVWNVCVSGGNLYAPRSKLIKGSLITCFKASNLNEALNKIVDGDRSKFGWKGRPQNEFTKDLLDTIEEQKKSANELTDALGLVHNEFTCKQSKQSLCEGVFNQRIVHEKYQIDPSTLKPDEKTLPYDSILKIMTGNWYEIIGDIKVHKKLTLFDNDPNNDDKDIKLFSDMNRPPPRIQRKRTQVEHYVSSNQSSAQKKKLKNQKTSQIDQVADSDSNSDSDTKDFTKKKVTKATIKKMSLSRKIATLKDCLIEQRVYYKPEKELLMKQFDRVSKKLSDALTYQLMEYVGILDDALKSINNDLNSLKI